MSDLSQRIAGLSPAQLEMLAQRLKKKGGGAARAQSIPRRADDAGPAPLSFAQRRMWFLEQLEPGNSVYNIPAAVRLSGRLDDAALQRALDEIVRRHESLRTTFPARDGEPVQLVRPAEKLTLARVDISGVPPAERDAEAARLAAQEAARPFDLAAGPLVRASLVKLGAEEHLFLVTMHHIVSDGWSAGVLTQEIAALYHAFSSGAPSPLAELPIQYADFAAWQRERLQGETLDAHLSYWKRQLGDAPRVLELPADRPRPPARSQRGAHLRFALTEELSRRLRALSQQEGATLFMTLLAGFKALLHRYTNQTDIVVGTPVANRDRAETEPLIGLLINTLVLRTNFAGASSFRELLRREREVVLGAHAHADMPFEKLVEELQPERSTSHAPLFQVEFFLDNAQRAGLDLAGLKLSPVWAETGTAKFDLTLAMEETETGLAGKFEYSTDLFDQASVERMARHFTNLLASAAAAPDSKLRELPLMDEDERRRILVEWNDTKTVRAEEACVHELFERQAAETPDTVAVAFEDEQVTYAELNARSNKLARHLRALGVAPETVVGLCLERSVEMLVAVLGVMKAGGAYLPLDPAHPKERLQFMLEDAGALMLVCETQHLENFAGTDARVINLDDARADIDNESDRNPQPLAVPQNAAYVIYTSGSTGKPKGVSVSHRSPVNLLRALSAAVYGRDSLSGLRASLNAPLSFDASVQQLMLLCAGATLDLIPQALRADGRSLLDYLDSRRVEAFDCTPSQLRVLLNAGLLDGMGRGPGTFLVAGEAIDAQLWKELAEGSERCGKRFHNIYGPTECTVDATSRLVTAREKPSIGRPLANYEVYILDAEMNPCAVNVTGEIYVGGGGLARGYLNRAGLTAERFIAHPFSKEPGARLYRTGDTGRYTGDGRVEYVGRADNQVKLRGYRIELGEIESVLARCPGVRSAVVAVREDGGEKRLVGYVVAESESASVGDVRDFLASRLPEYMIPSAFVALDELPLNANGKVDKAALPAPDSSRRETRNAYVAPRSQTEEMVARVWAEVLKLERVGVEDNFFELGGHSLLATQVTSRVREAFQVELPLRAFFESPTVAGLAQRVEAERREGQDAPPVPVGRVNRDGLLPLSFAQERMWFLAQFEPGNAAYNVPAAIRLKGALDVDALERSLNEIVRRHEILRTTYAELDGQPAQVVNPARGLSVALIDATGWPEGEREAQGFRLLAEEVRRPFDLAEGPLVRASLLKLADEEHVALLTLHHIVSDEWSMGVMLREVAALYAAYAEGRESSLEELPIQYADFAAWQREHLSGRVLEEQLAYWREHLGGAPAVLELPTDRPRPAVQSFRGARLNVTLPAELTARLKELGRAEGVTLFVVLLAGFKALLHRYTNQTDIVVGTPVANRNQLEVENLIGLFLNTLALRTNFDGAESFRQLLARVQDVLLGGYAHREVPFEKVVEALEPQRSLSHAPLFQVMFTLQNSSARQARSLGGLRMEPVETDEAGAKFDLNVMFEETGGALSGSFEYARDLFDAETIARMARHFEQLLASAVVSPERNVSELPLLSEDEERMLVAGWNDTARDYPQGVCLHQLFEAQAARTPERTALVADGRAMSYDELNARANRLARHLRLMGAGPERRVGVCLNRTAQLPVALLAVLKSGAAYVPLDPAYPQERLQFMLEDSDATVLLTESALAGRFDVPESKLLCLDTKVAAVARLCPANPEARSSDVNLAYVIYTSGSTGKPKGVALEHRRIVAFMRWARELYTDEELSGVLFSTSVCFDLSVYELFAPLSWGGTILLAENALQLPVLPEGTEIKLINTVPSAMAELVRLGLVPASARTVNLCGEALSGKLAREINAVETVERLYNLYGPTEDTVYSTVEPVGKAAEGTPSIGRPLSGSQAYVLDRNMRPVPVGVTGDLYLGGDGLARGYLNRPDLTADKFIPDPFSASPGARLYFTGDLARRLADGRLDFLGRSDHQVKIRGFRIELGEIEAALARHESVREVVVVARKEAGEGARLVAYIVAAEGRELSAGALREFLKSRLPEYMIPSDFVALAEMPVTPNGKTDRKRLPAPEQSRVGGGAEYVAPRDAVEEVLAGVWAEVLGLERVGVTDNFFDLGGHSLLATRVVSRLRESLRVQVPLRAVFESPTVAELASAAVAHESQPGATAKVARVIVRMKGMSAEEKRRMLRQRKAQGPGAAPAPNRVAAAGELTAAPTDAALVN